MTSTRSSSTNTKTRSATRRLESFRQRFGEGHFYLACHAALPLALIPDLLYSLWANFQRDTHGEAIEIPWIAVADLMLSNLCKEVGHELYEMDQAVRDELLNQLQNDSRFGLERIRELADFVMAYVEQQLDSPDLDARDLAQGQQWRALAYKNSDEAAHRIALTLSQLTLADKTEWIRLTALLDTLAEPLSEFEPLLLYAQGMKHWVRGNPQSAAEQLQQIPQIGNEVQIAGVSLPIPDDIKASLLKSPGQDVSHARPTNWRLWVLAPIACTTIAVIAWGAVTINKTPLDQDTVFKVKGTICPPATTIVTYKEATDNKSALSKKLDSLDIVRLANGASMDGSGYGSSIREKDSRRLGSALCKTLVSTAEQIMQIAPDAPPALVRQLSPYLNQAMAEFNITTPLRKAHFLAQTLHEFRVAGYSLEASSGADYEGRDDLGNTQPGDGQRFKGRGLIQVTGRTNYAFAGKALGVDLINNPQRLADPDLAALSAGWFWSTHQLNGDADNDDVRTVTRVINGGYSGLDDRIALLQAAKKAFGI